MWVGWVVLKKEEEKVCVLVFQFVVVLSRATKKNFRAERTFFSKRKKHGLEKSLNLHHLL